MKTKKWYNGYNYFGEPIYNPFDILLFFSNNCEFRNYWWETGNPSFFIDKLKEENYFLPDLENIEISPETLNAFDVEYIGLVALLRQTGYLTFAGKLGDEQNIFYKMKVPNPEIQKSLNSLFFDYLCKIGYKKSRLHLTLLKALKVKDLETFKSSLITMFASISYDNYVKNTVSIYEGYYASVIFAFLSSIGFLVKTEKHTNLGRVDMSLIAENNVYIPEFKVDMPEEAAFQQIETNKYYEKYQNQAYDIILVSIHFCSEKRNIESMKWKMLK